MKYIIWLKDRSDDVPECYSVGRKWTEQGDGPLTENQATRIAREILCEPCAPFVRVLPCGQTPIDL